MEMGQVLHARIFSAVFRSREKCDQMLEYQVAQFYPKFAQKVA